MARTKSKSAKSWERLLVLLTSGGPVTKKQIEKNVNYDFMYRLSSLIYEIKLYGGVIKVQKEGRKVVSYELVNIPEMQKYLASRGLSTSKDVSVEKLTDLKAKKVVETKSADVATVEVDVIEVTEVTA